MLCKEPLAEFFVLESKVLESHTLRLLLNEFYNMQDLSAPLDSLDSVTSVTSSYDSTKELNIMDLTNDVEGTHPSNDTTNTTTNAE